MVGLVPGIHVLLAMAEDVDGRDKPDHNEFSCENNGRSSLARSHTRTALKTILQQVCSARRHSASAFSGSNRGAAVDEDGQYCFAVAL